MLIGLTLVAVLAVGCGGGAAYRNAKTSEPVSTTLAQTPATTSANPSTTQSTNPAGTSYKVVAEQSQASYSVGETFLGKKLDVTAVGKTASLSGEIRLEGGVIKPSTVEVDLASLTSDESRRDNQVRKALDTANHPKATFNITGAEGNPVLADGKETPLKLQGTMRIKGVDKPVTFEAKAKMNGESLNLTAATTFPMTQFGVNPPNIAGFVAVQDNVKLDVTFVGKK